MHSDVVCFLLILCERLRVEGTTCDSRGDSSFTQLWRALVMYSLIHPLCVMGTVSWRFPSDMYSNHPRPCAVHPPCASPAGNVMQQAGWPTLPAAMDRDAIISPQWASAAAFHQAQTCYTGPGVHARQQKCRRPPHGGKMACKGASHRIRHERLTNTAFALQILQLRFLTFPSALTTPGANSMPNLSGPCQSPRNATGTGAQLTSCAEHRRRAWRICPPARPARRTPPRACWAQSPRPARSNCAQSAAGPVRP